MISPPTKPTTPAWIHSPTMDLIVGCGAWSAPFLLLPYVFARIGENWALGFYTLALVINYPHYMATIYRAYGTKEDFVRYRAVTVYVTTILVATLITAHWSYRLVPWLVTIYLTWSPWHYMGQNFGLAMMFIHRNGVKIDRKDRNALWMSFIASYMLIFLRFHSSASTDPFVISLGLPKSLQLLRIPLIAVFAFGIVPLGKWIRQAGWSLMLASLTLYITQFLWSVLPTLLETLKSIGAPQIAYTASALAVMHCAQYLWITSHYARQEAKAESSAWRWQPYFATLVIGGMALFVPGPWMASYALGRDFAISGLVFTSVVNIHHFILDGAIWKLRDTRVRSLLTVQDPALTNTITESSWPAIRTSWRQAGVVAIVVLLVIAGIDQVRYYAGNRSSNLPSIALAAAMNPNDSVMQMRLARAYEKTGDQARMEGAFRQSIRMNPDNLEGQNALARVLLESGRYDEAYAHYKQMFAHTEPDAEALMNFGALCKQFNRHDEAVKSFEAVLIKVPNYAPAHLLLAEMLDADGNATDAISHYERYIALNPVTPATPIDPQFRNAIARIEELKQR